MSMIIKYIYESKDRSLHFIDEEGIDIVSTIYDLALESNLDYVDFIGLIKIRLGDTLTPGQEVEITEEYCKAEKYMIGEARRELLRIRKEREAKEQIEKIKSELQEYDYTVKDISDMIDILSNKLKKELLKEE